MWIVQETQKSFFHRGGVELRRCGFLEKRSPLSRCRVLRSYPIVALRRNLLEHGVRQAGAAAVSRWTADLTVREVFRRGPDGISWTRFCP